MTPSRIKVQSIVKAFKKVLRGASRILLLFSLIMLVRPRKEAQSFKIKKLFKILKQPLLYHHPSQEAVKLTANFFASPSVIYYIFFLKVGLFLASYSSYFITYFCINLSELIKYLQKNEKKQNIGKTDRSSYMHSKRTQMFLKSDLIKYFRNRGALTMVVYRVMKGKMHAITEHVGKQQGQRDKKESEGRVNV